VSAAIVEASAICAPERLAELASLLEKGLDGFPPPLADPARRQDYIAKLAALADIAEYREDGALAGAIAVYANDPEARRAFISYVAVDPLYRGRGIARALLGLVVDHLRAKGFAEVELKVRKGNETALRLYSEAGFRVVGEADGEIALAAALEQRP
jgi:ribosomal protein S18 acetylase RimI-like enzyme